jgi:hypothetical protein
MQLQLTVSKAQGFALEKFGSLPSSSCDPKRAVREQSVLW